MKLARLLLDAALATTAAASTINEPCVGDGNVPGVCIAENTCTSKGGQTSVGACPATPNNIKCCTKSSCGGNAIGQGVLREEVTDATVAGNCRWVNDCTGTSVTGECPGPGQFQCCQSAEINCGGYDPPGFVKTGCKQVAINGGEEVIKQFPGRIRVLSCQRNDPGSDHNNGMATDIAVSKNFEQATLCGQDIAEWVQKNRAALNVKYVIWGQRIWNVDRDPDDEILWPSWRAHVVNPPTVGIRVNHWDHIHVSYND